MFPIYQIVLLLASFEAFLYVIALISSITSHFTFSYMLSVEQFLNKCERASRNKRIKGYQNHLPVIRKFMKNHIWETLKKRKITLEELKALSFGYNIAESTIRNWNKKHMEDEDWLPLHIRTCQKNQMSEQEEIIIAELLRQIIEEKNVPLYNSIDRKLSTTYFYIKHMDDFLEEEYDEQSFENKYNASSNWIVKFKRRHGFSRRKYHRKRRSNTSLKKIIKFLKQFQVILNKAEPSHILNVDETCWCFQESGEYTWAPTGAESVSIYSSVDEKSNFTCLATINLAAEKFPLVLISKGSTELSESNWFGGGRNIINGTEEVEVARSFCFGERIYKYICATIYYRPL